jgi:hypothetical protein
MIALQHHIEELRAEPRDRPDPSERAEIVAELEAAMVALDQQNRAADARLRPR